MASILKVDQIQESTSGVGTNFSTTGSATTPTISIGNQTNKGFYHLGADKIGVSIGGVRTGEIGSGYGGFTGNVIQFLDFTSTFAQNISTASSYTDINISAGTPWEVPITPRYSNSKIIVIHNLNSNSNSTAGSLSMWGIGINRRISSGSYSLVFEPVRDSSGAFEYGIQINGVSHTSYNRSINIFVDNPNTTNAVTYKLSARVYQSATSLNLNTSTPNISGRSYIYLLEVQQ